MTDHPDLEALDAVLEHGSHDDHVRVCAVCRGRLAQLRAARHAVAEPVPPVADEVRDRAIAQALAAADEWGQPATAPPVAPRPWQPGTQPLSGPATQPPLRSGTQPGTRWRWWVGGSAAAALLAVVLGTAALVGQGSNDRSTTALSSGASPESRTSGDQAVDAGDFGDVASVDALRAKVATGRAVAAPSAASAAAPSADAGAPVPRQVGTRVCEIEARTARPQLGVVVYAANLRFQGTPAVVLGFAPTAAGPPEMLLVMAPQQACRVLAETTPS